MNVIETHSLTPEVIVPLQTMLNSDAPDPTEKEWLLYWNYVKESTKTETLTEVLERRTEIREIKVTLTETFRTVSILKVYDKQKPYRLVVARAFCSPYDNFFKKKGRGIAYNRFHGLLANYEKTGVDFYQDTENKFVIFQVTQPVNLLDNELTFFNETILPRLEGQPRPEKMQIQ